MDPVDDAGQGRAGRMQQAGMRPDAVIGRDLVQLLEEQHGDGPAEPAPGLARELGRAVGRDHVEAARQHRLAVLAAAAAQFEDAGAGAKPPGEEVDAAVLGLALPPGIGAGFGRVEVERPVVPGCHASPQLLLERIAAVAMPAPISSVPPALLKMPTARGLRTTARAREATSA